MDWKLQGFQHFSEEVVMTAQNYSTLALNPLAEVLLLTLLHLEPTNAAPPPHY